MIPLVDIHVHLLAGLDDGPRTLEDAVAMCRIAAQDGVQAMAATAHQNERWREVTPHRIVAATEALRAALHREGVPVAVFPSAEVMAGLDTPQAWCQRTLLSVADRGHYLLLEMPRGVFVDLVPTVRNLRESGVRTILAHPEKESDFLHGDGIIEELIEAGCLVQVSASSITDPKCREDSVAGELLDRAPVAHADGRDRVEVLLEDAVERLGVERAGERHPVHDVDEEDGDEPAKLHPRPRGLVLGERQGLVLAEDRALERLELGAGLDPELGDERLPPSAVLGQRVRLPA